MSESDSLAPGAQASAAPSAGALLRAAREQSGLPVAEFAALLKVTPRRVELIEADQFDQLPDAVFVRALAQTMCRTLKIDAAPVLALLPQILAQRLDQVSVGLNASFREGPSHLLPDDWLGRAMPFLGGAALLVAGVLIFYFLPSNWPTPAKVSPRTVTAAPATVAAEPLPPPQVAREAEAAVARSEGAAPSSASAAAQRPIPAPIEAEHAAPAKTASAKTAPSASAGSTAPTVPTAPTRSAVPAVPAVAVAAPAAVAPAATAVVAPMVTATKTPAAPALAGLLQFRTSEVAWVEVHDANGSLLLSRELRAGEAVVVNGATPLKVTIGNVKATQVAFRGKAMDLRSFTRDNIARIELQ